MYFQWIDHDKDNNPIRDFRPSNVRWLDKRFMPPYWMVFAPIAPVRLKPGWSLEDEKQYREREAKRLTSVDAIMAEMNVAASLFKSEDQPLKLGGFYYVYPNKKSDWTRSPELIASQMNRSSYFDFHVSAPDIVRAQKRLGIWSSRKNRESWEFDIT